MAVEAVEPGVGSATPHLLSPRIRSCYPWGLQFLRVSIFGFYAPAVLALRPVGRYWAYIVFGSQFQSFGSPDGIGGWLGVAWRGFFWVGWGVVEGLC